MEGWKGGGGLDEWWKVGRVVEGWKSGGAMRKQRYG